MKNGVFGMVLLMIVYGMFVPNDPRNAAKVVLSMALVLVITLTYVMENPDVEPMIEQLRTTAHAGSNILFLAIGAGAGDLRLIPRERPSDRAPRGPEVRPVSAPSASWAKAGWARSTSPSTSS